MRIDRKVVKRPVVHIRPLPTREKFFNYIIRSSQIQLFYSFFNFFCSLHLQPALVNSRHLRITKRRLHAGNQKPINRSRQEVYTSLPKSRGRLTAVSGRVHPEAAPGFPRSRPGFSHRPRCRHRNALILQTTCRREFAALYHPLYSHVTEAFPEHILPHTKSYQLRYNIHR